jgi:hypothetical protein
VIGLRGLSPATGTYGPIQGAEVRLTESVRKPQV